MGPEKIEGKNTGTEIAVSYLQKQKPACDGRTLLEWSRLVRWNPRYITGPDCFTWEFFKPTFGFNMTLSYNI